MKTHYSFILMVVLILGGCASAPSSTPEQALPSITEQIEVATATPFPTGTQTPLIAITLSPTITPEKQAELVSSPSPTSAPLSSTAEPTLTPPPISKLQIINRTNVDRIIPLWRYEPQDHQTESQRGEFSFSPNGKTIALTMGQYIELMNLETGQIIQKFALDHQLPAGWDNSIYEPTFSPGGNRLAGLQGNNNLILWNVSTGKVLWEADWGDVLHTEAITRIIFSPGGNVLVTTSIESGSDIRIWSAQTGKMMKALDASNQLDADFSPDGSLLYTIGRVNGVIFIWDTKEWKLINTIQAISDPTALSVTPNGEVMAVNSGWYDYGGLMTYLFLVKSWKQIGKISGGESPSPVSSEGPIRIEPSFNIDGGILALAIGEEWEGPPNHVEIWDTNSLRQLAKLEEYQPIPVTKVSFSPDGRLLVARSENGTTIFWGIPSEQR